MTESVDNFSIHGNSIKEVYDIPMSAINRPFQSALDRSKVDEMKQKLNDPDHNLELTPIDVHHVHYKDENYYFLMGACHRYTAHKELDKPTIRAKLIKTPPSVINTYLGASSPFKS